MKRRYFAGTVAGILIAGTLTTPAFAWTQVDGVATVCFQPNSLTAIVDKEAKIAAEQWNQVTTGLDVTYGNCAAGDNVVPLSLANSSTDLGETNVDTLGKDISTADITWSVAATEEEAAADGVPVATAWLSVTCHEMGHALGLDHRNDADTCMIAVGGLDQTKPGAFDKQQLISFYGGTAKSGSTAGSAGDATTGTADGSVVLPDAASTEDTGSTGVSSGGTVTDPTTGEENPVITVGGDMTGATGSDGTSMGSSSGSMPDDTSGGVSGVDPGAADGSVSSPVQTDDPSDMGTTVDTSGGTTDGTVETTSAPESTTDDSSGTTDDTSGDGGTTTTTGGHHAGGHHGCGSRGHFGGMANSNKHHRHHHHGGWHFGAEKHGRHHHNSN